jgi:uncharacterized metal-binding protein YceD (DUF177 family)
MKYSVFLNFYQLTMDLKIAFRGLKEGKHEYEYSLGKSFFESFEDSEFSDGNLLVNVTLIKRPSGIETFFSIKGEVKVACDRCLDEFFCPIEYDGKLFFEFGQVSEEVSHELIMIGETEDYINLGNYIYEFALLSLPVQRIHPDDEEGNSLCNAEMIARFTDGEENTDESDEGNDPRWDKLKDLLN